jgi:hypothetical protein
MFFSDRLKRTRTAAVAGARWESKTIKHEASRQYVATAERLRSARFQQIRLRRAARGGALYPELHSSAVSRIGAAAERLSFPSATLDLEP